MRFEYYPPYIIDNLNEEFKVKMPVKSEALILKKCLNNLYNQINYQERVINKCIKNEKKYKTMIIDKDYTIEVLLKEKKILKKIIADEGVL